MNPSVPAAFVVVDTSVLSYLTRSGTYAPVYQALIGRSRVVVPFVAETELRGSSWGKNRMQRLDALLAQCVISPMTAATGTQFTSAAAKRATLGFKSAVGDNDLWIVATAAEHSVPLVTHDVRQGQIALAMGVVVLSAMTIP